jgi:hypothetical protein
VTVTTPTDAEATTSPEAPRPVGTSRVAGILGGHLSFYWLIWVGIGAVLLTAQLVANGVWGDVDASLWDGQASIFQYAMLAGGIMVVTGYVPVIVTQGVTRRAAVDGSLVAVAGLALAGAVATTLAFAVEDLVFALNDWPHVLDSDLEMHIYDRPDQYGLILLEVLALYATHVVAGMVIGAGLFRFGWVRGTGYLLGGVALAVVGEYLVGSGFAGVRLGDVLGLDQPPVGAGLAGVAALLAAGTACTRRLIRGLPVDIRHAAWWR